MATTFMFALDRGATADARVRRALNLAVDVPALIGDLFAGRAEPSVSPYTPTQLGFDPALEPIHDAACFDSSPHSTFRLLREKFHAGARGPWWLGYANERFDALVDEAQRSPDLARRRTLYRQAARLLRDDAPWLYLYVAQLGWGLGPEHGVWRPTADGLIDFGARPGSGRATLAL